jgi:hypothetical protein
MRIWQVSKGSDINSLLASRTMKSLNQKDATLHATPRDADLPLAPRPGIQQLLSTLCSRTASARCRTLQ